MGGSLRAKVDLSAKRIEASVRGLVTPPEEGNRSIGLLARLRAELGQEIHREYRQTQAREQPGFQAEVPLEIRHSVDGFEALIGGRLDGSWARGAKLYAEEVKSVALTGAELRRLVLEEIPDYHLQLQLYGLGLAQAHPEAEIVTRLQLYSVLDRSRRTVSFPFDRGQATARLEELLRQAIAEARAEAVRRAAAFAAAEDLRFPFPQARPHQLELTEFIARGFEAGRPVLAQAPTGIGKTVCALLAGLRFALRRGGMLFFLTSRNTQQEQVARAFQQILGASGPAAQGLRAVILRAKERMCPPGDLLCHPEHCAYLRDFERRAGRGGVLEDLLRAGSVLEPELVYARGEKEGLCPFELGLALISGVDLVICDYNYVYDPAVSLGRFQEEFEGRPSVVVLDEAHNLFDRARGYYSPFVSLARVEEVAARIAEGAYLAPREGRALQPSLFDEGPLVRGPQLFSDLAAFCGRLRELIGRQIRSAQECAAPGSDGCYLLGWGAGPEAGGQAGGCDWEAWAAEAARLLIQYAIYNRLHELVHARDPLPDLLRMVMRMRDAQAEQAAEFHPYVATTAHAGGPGVGVLCVNPARKLAVRHRRVAGTLAMSATLSPLPYYSEVLGLAPLGPELTAAPSPFPPENRCVLIEPSVWTTYQRRAEFYEPIARLIETVVGAHPGGYVAFFPSYAFLSEVARRLRLPKEQLLVQTAGMPEALRRAFLERMRKERRPRLLLAVSGGVFAEGVDLPGEALIGAIVVGPCLPGIGFERSVMRSYFDEQSESGFAYALLYPGMQRVIQAAGRVIRTMEDKGVIVMLDARFVQPPYADCIPEDWYRASVQDLVTRDLARDLARFWEGQKAPAPSGAEGQVGGEAGQ